MKANAAKGHRFAGAQRYAHRLQGLDSVRHQPLAAGLIDRRPGIIGHSDTIAPLRGQNGGCEAGGAAADDKNIGRMHERVHSVFRPGPESPIWKG
jgi:hypothetical protein